MMARVKGRDLPQQAEVAQGDSGRLKPRIFQTFGTTRVVVRQPFAPAAFTPGEIPGTHLYGLSRLQGTWFCRQLRKKSPVTPQGIDPETVRLVAQYLNHQATPGPDGEGKPQLLGVKIVPVHTFHFKCHTEQPGIYPRPPRQQAGD